jgi:hypothetical protein
MGGRTDFKHKLQCITGDAFDLLFHKLTPGKQSRNLAGPSDFFDHTLK